MDKRLLALGLLLIVASFFVGVSQAPKIPQNVGQSTSTALVAVNSFAYGSVYLNSTSVLEFYYAATTPVNFYLMGSGGFDGFRTSNSANAFNVITPQNGLLYETVNSTLGAVPYQDNMSKNVSVPVYESSNLTYGAGTYVFLFSNSGNAISNVTYGYIYLPVNEILGGSSGYGSAFTAGSMATAALFFAGIVVAVMSLFRGRDRKEQAQADLTASRIYERMGTGRRRKVSSNKRKTKR